MGSNNTSDDARCCSVSNQENLEAHGSNDRDNKFLTHFREEGCDDGIINEYPLEKQKSEVLPPTYPVTVFKNIFTPKSYTYYNVEGDCIEDLVELAKLSPLHTVVIVNDELIERDVWTRSIPEEGDSVIIRFIPQGEDSGKFVRTLISIFSTILSIAFPALAPVFMIGGVIINFGISLFFAPPKQKLYNVSSRDSKVITGSRNELTPWAPVPVVIGEFRVWPMLAAKPYSETVGGESFLRLIFEIGMGTIEFDESNFKIGETPLSEFTDVEVEIREGTPTDLPRELFTYDVTEESCNIKLPIDIWYMRVTDVNVTEGNIDISFPYGLINFSITGKPYWTKIAFNLEYRVTDPVGSWTPVVFKMPLGPGVESLAAGDFTIEGEFRGFEMRGLAWNFPSANQYDVRIKIEADGITRGHGDPYQKFEDVYWTKIRSSRPVDPILIPEVATISLRIKATDQLSGIVDTFNCYVKSKVPMWNGLDEWEIPGYPFLSNNPAWHFANALRGNANKNPISDNQIDASQIAIWADYCDAEGFEINAVVDTEKTLDEVLRDICATTRASLTMKEGKYSVVIDKEQDTPVQVFTPRNIKNFNGKRQFASNPHALKVRFISPEDGWQTAERIVYDDGYSSDGAGGTTIASEFVEVDFWGITDPDLAYKHGRYHIAASRLRRAIYSFETDWEHIICNRGDRVDFMHDAPLLGISTGRVTEVLIVYGVLFLRLDEAVPMTPGINYGVKVRKQDNIVYEAELYSMSEEDYYTVIGVLVYTPNGVDPEVGDLFVFGEHNIVTRECVINGITPLNDLTARVELYEYNDGIYDADTCEIPPYIPGTSVPSRIENRTPSAPIILDICSDERVLIYSADGNLIPRIVIRFAVPSFEENVTEVQSEFRRSNPEGAWRSVAPSSLTDTEASVIPVEELKDYDVRIRFITLYGVASKWSITINHTVIGRTNPPPAPTNAIVSIKGIMNWDYPDVPNDFAGFEIRYQNGSDTDWDSAGRPHAGLLSDTMIDLKTLLPITRGNQVTVMVKAVDTTDTYSIDYAYIVTTLLDSTVRNVLWLKDFKTAGWPGYRINCYIEGGTNDLVASADSSGFWSGNDYTSFWTIDTNLFWVQFYMKMDYVCGITPPVAGTLKMNLNIVGTTWRFVYSYKGVVADWPGELEVNGIDVVNFGLSVFGGNLQGRVSTFQAVVDVEDRKIQYLNTVVPATGAFFLGPPTPLMNAINDVLYSIQQDGFGGTSVQVIGKVPATGPQVIVLNAAGVRVQGLVDFIVEGY